MDPRQSLLMAGRQCDRVDRRPPPQQSRRTASNIVCDRSYPGGPAV